MAPLPPGEKSMPKSTTPHSLPTLCLFFSFRPAHWASRRRPKYETLLRTSPPGDLFFSFLLPPPPSARVLIPIHYYVHLVHYVAAHRTTQDCFSPAPTLFFKAGAVPQLRHSFGRTGKGPSTFLGAPRPREKNPGGQRSMGQKPVFPKKSEEEEEWADKDETSLSSSSQTTTTTRGIQSCLLL